MLDRVIQQTAVDIFESITGFFNEKSTVETREVIDNKIKSIITSNFELCGISPVPVISVDLDRSSVVLVPKNDIAKKILLSNPFPPYGKHEYIIVGDDDVPIPDIINKNSNQNESL